MSKKPREDIKIENISDYEYDSNDRETYQPKNEDIELKGDERVYNLLEYINLEWPSQIIATKDSFIFHLLVIVRLFHF